MEDQNSPNNIKVKIYGTEYPIKGDSDVEYMQKVAQFVDQKMQEVERGTSAKSTLKVAILTALNIADELFRERQKNEKLNQQIEDQLHKFTSLIDSIDK